RPRESEFKPLIIEPLLKRRTGIPALTRDSLPGRGVVANTSQKTAPNSGTTEPRDMRSNLGAPLAGMPQRPAPPSQPTERVMPPSVRDTSTQILQTPVRASELKSLLERTGAKTPAPTASAEQPAADQSLPIPAPLQGSQPSSASPTPPEATRRYDEVRRQVN